MFFHLFKYKLLTIFREKMELFWVLAFPIILGTCFYFAFNNITEQSEAFHTVDTAIVLEGSENEAYIKQIFDSIATDDKENEALIKITYTDMSNATELLNNEEINGIISFNGIKPALTIKENGIDETILKEILDIYIQTMNIIGTLSATTTTISPNLIEEVLTNTTSGSSYINTLKLTDGNADNITDYFYSLISMACLFASLIGTTCAKQMKADLSPLGLRKNLVPVNRLTIILSDFLACYSMLAVGDVLLIIYLEYILKVNLGGNFFLILLVALMGSLIGLSSGVFIGSIPKLSPTAKEGINICGSLFLCFLSGLMVSGIKQFIDRNIPIFNKINPATVITDALYSLNIYDTYDKYISSLLILLCFSIVFCTLSFIMTRRETYASV